MGENRKEEQEAIERERWEILHRIDDAMETPMVILGFVWLALLVVEFTRGLTPLLANLVIVIWVIFIIDFALRFFLAPRKLAYLAKNWLTALALAVPALRVFRIARVLYLARAARAARGLNLVRVLATMNRGMRALGATMSRRGFSYVMTLTFIILLAGSAGMYVFENNPGGRGLNDYGTALWWTAMILTTMGSEYWPQTAEGRVLTLFLAVYAFGIFGYVAATLASFFVNRDAEEGEIVGTKSMEALRAEIEALRADLRGRDSGKS